MKTLLQRPIYLTITLLLLCLFFSLSSQAEEKRAYNIEVIIFKYNEPAGFNAETWPETWAIPDLTNSYEIARRPNNNAAKPIAPNNNGQFLDGNKRTKRGKRGFKRLPATAFQLNNEVKRLRKSSRYTVLKHTAWRQPGLDAKSAIPLRIRAGQAYTLNDYNSSAPELTYELDGTIKVVLGRYLHVYTDLLYTQPIVQVIKNKINVDEIDGAPEKIIYENILASAEQDNASLYGFSIQQHRRMRSKKLHHLDHPLIGILVYATRVEDTPTTN